MMLLFVIPGWGRLTGFRGIVDYIGTADAPMPMVAVATVVTMEFGAGIALLIGF